MQNESRPPSARKPSPVPTPGWRIRQPVAADLDLLVALEAACFGTPWAASALAAELAHESAILALAEGWPAEEGAGDGTAPSATPPTPRALGYAAYRTAAGEAELLRLAVAPEARRRGVATALLAAGDAALAAAGADRCFLEVRASNRGALAFYLDAGFHRIGLRRGYYPDGDDAVLMARSVRPGQAPRRPPPET